MASVDVTPLPPSPAAEKPTPETAGPAESYGGREPRRAWLPAALFVAALGFLLASFPATNSDLWARLAEGRDLSQGQFPFGADPRFPAELAVNQTWLFNLLCYGLYALLGGAGLVVVKSLLVAGLALVLLRLSGTGRGWEIPAACTALALLAVGTRLPLQPVTVSYLFLALALWILRPREQTDPARPPTWLPPWPLLVLFVVWVNLDRWFLLGLGTAALVWLGRLLDSARQQAGERRAWLSLSARFLVSLVVLAGVCLLNPIQLRAFVPPPELWGPGSVGRAAVSEQVNSPFLPSYFKAFGWRPVSLAYFPLLVLGLFSFALNRAAWCWRQFLPWFGLALLSGVQARAIPFFAVVAGPALAWNVQGWLARRPVAPSRRLVGGRALAVVLGLALLVCAWPGWLGDPPFQPRRWAVVIPPSLERGAEAIRRWHQEGKLGLDTRGLHLSPDSVCAFAWFCPEEKTRLARDLTAALREGNAGPRLREQAIDHVIVYDRDRGSLSLILQGLLRDPRQWPLLYLEGDLAIFGHRDPGDAKAKEDRFRGWELDLERLAFDPAQAKRAPPKGPGRDPEIRRWWEAFWKSAPQRSADSGEATFYLLYAEALRHSEPLLREAVRRRGEAWVAFQAAGLLGAAGGWAGPGIPLLDCQARLTLVPLRADVFSAHFDDTPPALLYLAIRAARRALAANPDDAQAHFVLGECYLRLRRSTRERVWGGHFPELVRLRLVQASTALNRSIALRPNFAPAHLSLGGLYSEMGFLDLALKHFDSYFVLTRKSRDPLGGAVVSSYPAPSEEYMDRLAKAVDDSERAFGSEARGARVIDRALLARQRGLAGKARDLLLESERAAFGTPGMTLELDLLLRTGRVVEVRDWMVPQDRAAPPVGVGAGPYHWMRAQAFAAAGDYALAEDECDALTTLEAPADLERVGAPQAWEELAMVAAQAIVEQQPIPGGVPQRLRQQFVLALSRRRVVELAARLRQESKAHVLRGLLALEEGEVGRARSAFRQALAVWADAHSRSKIDFPGRVAAQTYLRWLEEK